MLSNSINLAIVDDNALFRKTLRHYLSDQTNISIPLQASEMYDLFGKLQHIHIDLLLTDIFMPGLNGIQAIKMIREEYPAIKILVLSMSADIDLISDLLDAGIHGYISKTDEPEELLQAIRTVAEDRIYRNKIYTEALYRNRQNTMLSSNDQSPISLTEREKRILQLIWEEKSNKEIADEFFLGVRSVEKIRQDMKEKVGVKSTVGLLKFAINRKIIESSHGPFSKNRNANSCDC